MQAYVTFLMRWETLPEMKSSTPPLRVGLFGIGLQAYWPQFNGLKERLEGYQVVSKKLERPDVEIINLGLIDSPERAMEAGHQFRREDVDVIFLYVTTYALSSTVLPVVRRAKVPVIVLNLQPTAAIDYAAFNALSDRTRMTGDWLAYCSACPVPEIANVFKRTGIPFHQVTGVLEDDPACWNEIGAWLDAARVANVIPLGVYHGKVGQGLSVEMNVKHGPVSVVEDRDGSLFFLVAEGESVPEPILEIGNTNSRYKFAVGARSFVNNWNSHGPAHHCAVGVGHISDKLAKLAALLDIRIETVC